MVTAKNIHKYYGDLEVLKGVDLHIKKGEIVAIVGPSGAGKTTLLQILGTLDKPLRDQDFELSVNGVSLKSLNDKEISSFRNQHIGFIFQFHQLLPEFTALENVCIPAFIAKKGKKETEERAKEILDFLGLSERIHHKPNELSGGEQQRVAVGKDIVIKAIKTTIRGIDRESTNFKCLLESFANSSFSDKVIYNLIAEKIKNLLASGESEEIIFALRTYKSLAITDAKKSRAIKTLIQDINEDQFTGESLTFVKEMKEGKKK